MNLVGSGTLGRAVISSLTAEVRGLITDSDTTTAVVLFTPGSSTMDPASGLITEEGDSDAVSGYLSPLTLRQVEQSAGAYQVGDVRLLVMAADLTRAPTVDSVFRAGSTRYSILTVVRDPLGVFYELIGRST